VSSQAGEHMDMLESDTQREGIEAIGNVLPLSLVHCNFSIWLILSCILYNKTENVSQMFFWVLSLLQNWEMEKFMHILSLSLAKQNCRNL
jgi:hypothetical protein